jgi:hypothetical protein
VKISNTFIKQQTESPSNKHHKSLNSLFLLKWLTLAYILESLMIIYIPAQLVCSVMGGEGLFSLQGVFIEVSA